VGLDVIRQTAITIDLAAIRHNVSLIRSLAPNASICAVVKADAYGHGAVEVSRTLERESVELLAVASVEEGIELRAAGICLPVLVLFGAHEKGYRALVEHRLSPCIWREDQLQHYQEALGDAQGDFHIEVDTGMHRVGLRAEQLANFLTRVEAYPGLRLRGVYTHFANADLGDPKFNNQQLDTFLKASQKLLEVKDKVSIIHAANSAALLTTPRSHQGMIRPGLIVYGLNPLGADATTLSFRPAMRWTTRGIDLRDVKVGERVSYGGVWVASRDSRLLTLPVGYADGYPRHLTGKASVLIRGRRAPVVGTICMDISLVDVTELSGLGLDDEVVLMGKQGDAEITAYDLARWAQTIPYEIICGVQKRVHRHYVDKT
jgi:alanine racemase